MSDAAPKPAQPQAPPLAGGGVKRPREEGGSNWRCAERYAAAHGVSHAALWGVGDAFRHPPHVHASAAPESTAASAAPSAASAAGEGASSEE